MRRSVAIVIFYDARYIPAAAEALSSGWTPYSCEAIYVAHLIQGRS
jgi:hypothetical protein